LFSSVQRSVWMWQDVGIADDIWIRQLCHKLPSSDAQRHHVYVLQPLDGLSEFNKRVATMDRNDTPIIAEILGSCLAAAPMPDAHIIGDRQTDEHHQRLKSTMRGEGYTTDIAMLCCLSFMPRPSTRHHLQWTLDTTGDLTELRWKVKVYGHAHRKSKDYRDSLANLNFLVKVL